MKSSREQFEEEMSDKYEWFSDAIACADFFGEDDDGYYVGGDYIYHGTSCSEALFWLWRGWQASRAAIASELTPAYWITYWPDKPGEDAKEHSHSGPESCARRIAREIGGYVVPVYYGAPS